MTNSIHMTFTIPNELGGRRLDVAATQLLPDYSRTQVQEWIKQANLTLNGKAAKTKTLVFGGETLELTASLKPQPSYEAEPIDLNIIYEDEALLVINKPAGLVVHPAASILKGTLLNALLHYAPELQNLPRAGIIHRLDKDTSGLLVIAKTPAAYKDLTKQLKARTVTRIYQAIACGLLTSGGIVDEPIARHPISRKRMAIVETGKPAITHFRIMEKYRAHTRIKVQLETGRTHQIRVHMQYIQHPLLGDPVYGGRLQLPKGATPALIDILRQFKRQALHAYELGLVHPTTRELMTWQAPLPDDLEKLIAILKDDAKAQDKRTH